MRLERILEKSKHLHLNGNRLAFGNASAQDLVRQFGSPLYVYQEDVLRETCRRVKKMVSYPKFVVNFSIKANSNIALLNIVREEGLRGDAMSPGEIFLLERAGFRSPEMFFIPNNVAVDEFVFARDRGIQTSVDSLDQLQTYGQLFPGAKIAVRINPGIGDGHHDKVVTAGENAKFGVHISQIPEIQATAKKYGLTINGLNMHIGSNFLDDTNYLQAVDILLTLGKQFADLDFIDIGGGLGISYDDSEAELNLKALGQRLDDLFYCYAETYGKQITFAIEPGRYICAECGILLVTVYSIKTNPKKTFIGTDGGFNVLVRPMAYGSYHEIVNCHNVFGEKYCVDICGNICESGDMLAHDRPLTATAVGDILAVMDAGAYGYSMASNYNARLRPAEVLVTLAGEVQLIRRRDSFEDLACNQIL